VQDHARQVETADRGLLADLPGRVRRRPLAQRRHGERVLGARQDRALQPDLGDALGRQVLQELEHRRQVVARGADVGGGDRVAGLAEPAFDGEPPQPCVRLGLAVAGHGERDGDR